MTRAVTAARAADTWLFARVARARHHPLLDATVPRLTRAADGGLLWFAVAGGLALTGRRGRRAALRGIASLAAASALANGPAKWSVRRNRPSLGVVPELRRLRRQPITTSFPSGHSASAAAFTAGVVFESRARALPVAAAAAGVAYGRVYTGVHYPGDVAVGIALGAGSALLVRKVWPPSTTETAATAQAESAPALPDGDGLVVVVNSTAGSARSQRLERELRRALPRAEVVAHESGDLQATLRAAGARAKVLGVAGGDGTVNAATSVALEHGVPLAVIPAGTLDHFARDLGVHTVDDAVTAIRGGSAVSVTVGSAGGRSFLNTYAVGLYTELVRHRERHQRWLGKWPALIVALVEVLRGGSPVEVHVDDEPRRVWSLFVGNGRYLPSGVAPARRARLDGDELDVRLVRADRRWSRLRLVAGALSGRLDRSPVYEQRIVPSLALELAGGLQQARDGETEDAPPRLVVRPDDRRLLVYRPAGRR